MKFSKMTAAADDDKVIPRTAWATLAVKNLLIVLFCKVNLSKMESIKTNKITKTDGTILIQFFIIYNYAFGPVEILQL